MKPLNRETLAGLYRRLVAPRVSAAEREAAIEAIRFRGDLAASLFALQAVDLTQAEIDDALVRLDAALEPDPTLDDITDTVQREIAGVQLDVLAAESERRRAVYAEAEAGGIYLPARADLVGAVIGLATQLLDDPAQAHFGDTVIAITQIIRRQHVEGTPGAAAVAQVLREVDSLPPEEVTHKLDPWVRWAVALEILESPRGFAGIRFDFDPVTRAQAARAKRMLYAMDRQDARYDEVDWPLDLTGIEIARLLSDHATARLTWATERIPESDLVLYLTPTRREEANRPEPHVQVVPEAEAMELARRAGAFPLPMLYAIPPQDRTRLARQIWSEGLPPVPPNMPGLTFYDAGGDPRIRWGAPPHPYGLLCAIVLSPKDVLHVLHPDHPQDYERFNELTRRAEFMARSAGNYPETLRSILRSEGVRAVAHYHPVERYLHELVVIDPDERTVMVIRESVPSFMRGDSPLAIPRRDRRRPAVVGA